jgi:hypothetical protein
MGMPLIAGRDFTGAETREANDAAGATIISRRLAEAVFPDGSALFGSRLTLRHEGFDAAVDRALSEQRLFARTTGIFAAVAVMPGRHRRIRNDGSDDAEKQDCEHRHTDCQRIQWSHAVKARFDDAAESRCYSERGLVCDF